MRPYQFVLAVDALLLAHCLATCGLYLLALFDDGAKYLLGKSLGERAPELRKENELLARLTHAGATGLAQTMGIEREAEMLQIW